jgi:hypothetical protein
MIRLPLALSLVSAMVAVAGCGSSSSSSSDAAIPDTATHAPDSRADVAAPKLDAVVPDSAIADVGADSADAGRADAADAPVIDAPVKDAPVTDVGVATDTGSALDGGVTLAQVSSIFAAHCVGCHNGAGATASRLNLSNSPDAGTSLHDRLLGPLVFEAFCGMAVDAGAGSDGGGGIDGGGAARHAIVPGSTDQSFLYLKVLGQQPSPGTPPANCGVRMPRIPLPVLDGGTVTSVGCDQATGGAAVNCLGATDIETIRQWILQGAP